MGKLYTIARVAERIAEDFDHGEIEQPPPDETGGERDNVIRCVDCDYAVTQANFSDGGGGRIMFNDLPNGQYRCGVCDPRVRDPDGVTPNSESEDDGQSDIKHEEDNRSSIESFAEWYYNEHYQGLYSDEDYDVRFDAEMHAWIRANNHELSEDGLYVINHNIRTEQPPPDETGGESPSDDEATSADLGEGAAAATATTDVIIDQDTASIASFLCVDQQKLEIMTYVRSITDEPMDGQGKRKAVRTTPTQLKPNQNKGKGKSGVTVTLNLDGYGATEVALSSLQSWVLGDKKPQPEKKKQDAGVRKQQARTKKVEQIKATLEKRKQQAQSNKSGSKTDEPGDKGRGAKHPIYTFAGLVRGQKSVRDTVATARLQRIMQLRKDKQAKKAEAEKKAEKKTDEPSDFFQGQSEKSRPRGQKSDRDKQAVARAQAKLGKRNKSVQSKKAEPKKTESKKTEGQADAAKGGHAGHLPKDKKVEPPKQNQIDWDALPKDKRRWPKEARKTLGNDTGKTRGGHAGHLPKAKEVEAPKQNQFGKTPDTSTPGGATRLLFPQCFCIYQVRGQPEQYCQGVPTYHNKEKGIQACDKHFVKEEFWMPAPQDGGAEKSTTTKKGGGGGGAGDEKKGGERKPRKIIKRKKKPDGPGKDDGGDGGGDDGGGDGGDGGGGGGGDDDGDDDEGSFDDDSTGSEDDDDDEKIDDTTPTCDYCGKTFDKIVEKDPSAWNGETGCCHPCEAEQSVNGDGDDSTGSEDDDDSDGENRTKVKIYMVRGGAVHFGEETKELEGTEVEEEIRCKTLEEAQKVFKKFSTGEDFYPFREIDCITIMPCEGYDEDSDDYDETGDAEIIGHYVMEDYDEYMKWHKQTHKDSADDKTVVFLKVAVTNGRDEEIHSHRITDEEELVLFRMGEWDYEQFISLNLNYEGCDMDGDYTEISERDYWQLRHDALKHSATRSGRVYNRWTDEDQQNLRTLERLNRGSESVDEYQLEDLREKKKRSGSIDSEYTPSSDDDSNASNSPNSQAFIVQIVETTVWETQIFAESAEEAESKAGDKRNEGGFEDFDEVSHSEKFEVKANKVSDGNESTNELKDGTKEKMPTYTEVKEWWSETKGLADEEVVDKSVKREAFPGANYFLDKFEAEFDIEPADYIDTDVMHLIYDLIKIFEQKIEIGLANSKEAKKDEAVQLFMLNCDDRDERLKAHYRQGSVIDGKWVNSKGDEESESDDDDDDEDDEEWSEEKCIECGESFTCSQPCDDSRAADYKDSDGNEMVESQSYDDYDHVYFKGSKIKCRNCGPFSYDDEDNAAHAKPPIAEKEQATAYLLSPGNTVAKTVQVSDDELISREEWFPSSKVPMALDRVEVQTTQGKTGIYDYYMVIFDGHDRGEPNPIANWIAQKIGVPATGNFVFAHKRWDDDIDDEINVKVDKSLKELKVLFS